MTAKHGIATFDGNNTSALFGSLAKAAKSLARQRATDSRPTVKTSADPVFALIATHRKADAAHKAAMEEIERTENIHGPKAAWAHLRGGTKKSCHAAHDAFTAVMEAAATTLPGLIAKATYLQEIARQEVRMFEDHEHAAVQLIEGFSASIENVSATA